MEELDQPDAVFSVYKQIWRRAEEEGAWVLYYDSTHYGESAYFYPPDDEGLTPLIWILRPRFVSDRKPHRERNDGTTLSDAELRKELIGLAHEYGHFQSWKRSKDAGGDALAKWKKYDDVAHRRDAIHQRIAEAMPDGGPQFFERLREANQCELSDVDRARIVEEETIAWKYGLEILEQLRYDGLSEYNARAERGVHIYRYRLGMEDLWPGELSNATPTK